MICSFLFLLFRYSLLNRMFSNRFWQISWMGSPCVSNCSESTNLSTLQIVEMGTNAETKYFFKVSFLLGLVSKYTAASQVSGGTNYPDFQVTCPATAASFCSNMADEQGKLSDCGGNCGILVGNIGIILTKCSLSCGQHFRGHINTKISWILCVVINV